MWNESNGKTARKNGRESGAKTSRLWFEWARRARTTGRRFFCMSIFDQSLCDSLRIVRCIGLLFWHRLSPCLDACIVRHQTFIQQVNYCSIVNRKIEWNEENRFSHFIRLNSTNRDVTALSRRRILNGSIHATMLAMHSLRAESPLIEAYNAIASSMHCG